MNLRDRIPRLLVQHSLVVFAFIVLLAPHGSVLAQQVTVLRGATLIDGTGAEPVPDTTIVIRGNRIVSIGSNRIPRGAEVIDVSGKYVVPGLWDKHLHYKDWFGEMLVTNGITSAFVQSGGGQTWLHAQNEGVYKGKIKGPRMFFANARSTSSTASTRRGKPRESPSGTASRLSSRPTPA